MKRLTTGAALGLPRGALACWGARATIRGGAWRIPDGRQELVGALAHQAALVQALNNGVLQEVEQIERELHARRAYPSGVVVVIVNQPELVVLTRRAGGSVYITAFNRAPVPRAFTRPAQKTAARVARKLKRGAT